MKLALGTVQFGFPYGVANMHGQVSITEAAEIIRLARSAGMMVIDTAVGYGQSEEILGSVGVTDFSVISKLPHVPAGCRDIPEWIDATVRASLKRLRVQQLSGVLLHRPSDVLTSNGSVIIRTLSRMQAEGLIVRIGVSIYDPAELDAIDGCVPLEIVQAPYNVFDHRIVDSGWADRIRAQGGEIHVRSIFLQGALLMAPAERARIFSKWDSYFARFDRWLTSRRCSRTEACVAHVLAESRIDKVVVGVETSAQLEEVLMATSTAGRDAHTEDLLCDDETLVNPARWILF